MTDMITFPPRKSDVQLEIENAQLKAKMDVLERTTERVTSHLASIFDGIARGDQVELQYPDGQTVLITKARKRGTGEE